MNVKINVLKSMYNNECNKVCSVNVIVNVNKVIVFFGFININCKPLSFFICSVVRNVLPHKLKINIKVVNVRNFFLLQNVGCNMFC